MATVLKATAWLSGPTQPLSHARGACRLEPKRYMSCMRFGGSSRIPRFSPLIGGCRQIVRFQGTQAQRRETDKGGLKKADAKKVKELSGLTLESKPENEAETHRLILKNLVKYMWPKNHKGARARVLLALSLLIGSKVMNVQVPFYFKEIVDAMNIPWEQVGTAGTVFTGLVLTYGLARFSATFFGEMRNAIFATVAQRAIRQVSASTFEHIMKLDSSFHLSHATGKLTRAIDRGCKGISFVLSAMIFHIAPVTFEVALVSGVLSYKFGSSFAAVTVVTMLAYSWFTIRTTAWRSQFRRNANKADNIASGIATETLQNIESVTLFNNQKNQLVKYDKALADYEDSSINIAKSLSFLNSGQNLIFSTALTAIMFMTCNGIASSSLTVGDLILVNQLVFQLSMPLNFLGSVYRDLKQALLDMETLFTLQQEPIKIRNVSPDAPKLNVQPRGGEIRFENVSFAYRPGVPILQNASFVIPSGKAVAFVGSSGSGKSTILRLLFRLFEPQQGRILVDGQDIRQVDLQSLRKAIGVVPQDTPLFNDTIMNNVRFGNLGASDEECKQSVKRSELTTLIKNLPEGYDTMVGERGLMISGGERQRLAVARVLLKGAPINFFDEATSALDTETERALLRNIFTNFHGGTNIFIAHRLRTVANTDKVIVLREGAVAEQGSHSELLSREDSLYRSLWDAQENQEVVDQERKSVEN